MLHLSWNLSESFDPETGEFVDELVTVDLEYSLKAVADWEAQTHKPFLTETEKTGSETILLVKCMRVGEASHPNWADLLTDEALSRVVDYVGDNHTATWFRKDPTAIPNKEIITSEIIYYWMVSLQIPIECDTWNLNRLVTLIRVCSEKNKPKKTMSPRDAATQQRMLNEARRAKYHTTG